MIPPYDKILQKSGITRSSIENDRREIGKNEKQLKKTECAFSPQEIHYIKIQEEDSKRKNKEPKRKAAICEVWKKSEIHQIFQSYDQFGTRWSLIEKNFPAKYSLSKERSQNSIKNKFYGLLKNLLRTLFKQCGCFPGKKLRNLSANIITDIYDGRKDFKKYKGILKRLLESMDFEISRKKVVNFVESESQKITELYESIFKEQIPSTRIEIQPSAIQQRQGQPEQPIAFLPSSQNQPRPTVLNSYPPYPFMGQHQLYYPSSLLTNHCPTQFLYYNPYIRPE